MGGIFASCMWWKRRKPATDSAFGGRGLVNPRGAGAGAGSPGRHQQVAPMQRRLSNSNERRLSRSVAYASTGSARRRNQAAWSGPPRLAGRSRGSWVSISPYGTLNQRIRASLVSMRAVALRFDRLRPALNRRIWGGSNQRRLSRRVATYRNQAAWSVRPLRERDGLTAHRPRCILISARHSLSNLLHSSLVGLSDDGAPVHLTSTASSRRRLAVTLSQQDHRSA